MSLQQPLLSDAEGSTRGPQSPGTCQSPIALKVAKISTPRKEPGPVLCSWDALGGNGTCGLQWDSQTAGQRKISEDRSVARRRLTLAIALSLIFMVVEVIGGVLANSLAIMTDAAHLLSDVASFAISLFALWMGSWEATPRHSYGYHRMEILGALVSMQLIWMITGVLLLEAFDRLMNGVKDVDGRLMFGTAVFGVLVNLVLSFLLGHHHGGHGHCHGHDHDHDHGHGHGHGSGGAHNHNDNHGCGGNHVHGKEKDCGHDHDHDHGRCTSGQAHGDKRERHGHGGHRGEVDVGGHAHGSGCRHGHEVEERDDLGRLQVHGDGARRLVRRLEMKPNCPASVHKSGSLSSSGAANSRAPCGGGNGEDSGGLLTASSSESCICVIVSEEHDEDGTKKTQSNINLRGAYLHALGDLIQSIGVMIGGALIWYNPEWKVVDLICTLLFSVLVLFTTLQMLRDVMDVLMESTPRHINADEVLEGMRQLRGVADVHELHIWAITMGKVVLACHVRTAQGASAQDVLRSVLSFCESKYGISHATIQVEANSDITGTCGLHIENA